jgi:hypothetical protein
MLAATGVLVAVVALRAAEAPPVAVVALGAPARLQTTLAAPVTWTSANPSTVSVVAGWVFGKKAGTARVAATGAHGDRQDFTVSVAAGRTLAPGPAAPGKIDGFITREGRELRENGRPFRFISWNIPNLHVLEDPSWRQPPADPTQVTPVWWHRVKPEEQEDAVESVVQMGGQVIRAYTLSIAGGRNNRVGPSHYTGPGVPLDEGLMQDYDRMIAICGRHGVRLILPVIDEWHWFGGRKEFTALSGGGDFYTTRKVVDDFKALVAQFVNRVNTVTGIAYKDDPTIMAWETGNELQHVPRAWTAEIAAWLKLQAPRQLVVDGANGSIESADDPNVDLLTNHYYEHHGKDYIARALADAARMGAKRPFFIGEFGCTDPDMVIGTLDAALHSDITGALLWSLRFHSAEGGFYWHNEGPGHSAYHWPGFASNERSGERRVLAALRERAWAMRGFEAPPRSVPRAPVLLPDSTPAALVWRGSTGAETYVLERAAGDGPWTPVARDLTAAAEPFKPYADTTAPRGRVAYRLKAVNVAGESAWSAPLVLENP